MRGGLLHEVAHDVVGIVGVAHGVGGAQQHLEKDVGHGAAQLGEALPRVFFQKTQGNVKGRTAPAFQREEFGQQMGVVGRDGEHVRRAHPRGKQRLVRITHRGVGEQQAFFVAHPARKTLRAEFLQQFARTGGRGGILRHFGQLRFAQRLRGQGAAFHFGVAVDGDFAHEAQQARAPVAARFEVEEFGRVVDKARGALAVFERRVLDDVFQKVQIGCHAAHAKFAQRAPHAADGFIAVVPTGGDFHQQRIVKRRDDRAGVGGARVQPDTGTGGAAVGGQFAVIGREAFFRVFRGHPTLQRMAGKVDGVLRGQKIALPDARAFRDGNLRLDQIDAGDFFGDGVFDLNARVDFNEVERAAVRIHQKFHRTGVRVLNAVGNLQGGGA